MLSWNELAMLWDIPILFLALFGKFMDDLAVLEELLDSPHAKFPELGTDLLLTGYFRGVGRGILQAFYQERKNKTAGGYRQARR